MFKNLITLLALIILFWAPSTRAENSNDYEILLKDKYLKFYEIIERKNVSDFDLHKDIHIAVEMLEEVIKQYPRTRTAEDMLDMISHSIYWGNDPVMRDKYEKMKEKYLNTLDDPDTEQAEKLIFMVIAPWLEYEFTVNEKAMEKISILCNKGLHKMKDYCTNEDYAALALIEASKIDRKKYLNEFKEKYPNHPLISVAESYIKRQNFYDTNDYNEYIQATEKKYEKYKDEILPGGTSAEIGLYHFYTSIYYLMGDKEKTLKYYNIIKEKASDYYLLPELKLYFKNDEAKR